MSRGGRWVLAVALTAGVLVVGTTAVAAYALHRSGTFRVAVHEGGRDRTSFSLSLPGALLDVAIALCPLPERFDRDAATARLADLAPVLRAMAGELERLPDSVILDVRDRGERVRISKDGPVLRIRVTTADERVDIDLPLGSVRHALERLGSVASPAGV